MPDVTVMMGVPTYYTRLLADPCFDRDVSGLCASSFQDRLPYWLKPRMSFSAGQGSEHLERYGMTETGMSCSNP